MGNVFRSKISYALIGLLGLFGNSVFAAGFDCASARHPAEKFVCADKELSAKDDQLNALYKIVLATSAANEIAGITADQKTWVSQVRDVCTDRACLKTVYDNRIEALSRIDENTAYVIDTAESNKQVADFQASLERSGSRMKLDGCGAMIRIGTSAERSYGAFCRASGQTILMCDDTMVGKLTVTFRPLGSSQRVLADFTRNNCPPGG